MADAGAWLPTDFRWGSCSGGSFVLQSLSRESELWLASPLSFAILLLFPNHSHLILFVLELVCHCLTVASDEIARQSRRLCLIAGFHAVVEMGGDSSVYFLFLLF